MIRTIRHGEFFSLSLSQRPWEASTKEGRDKRFYVNTSVNPPQSSWQHPASLGPPPGPPPSSSPGPQRDNYGGPPNNYGPPPQQNWGPSGGYGGYPPQGGYPQGGYNNYGPGGYSQQQRPYDDRGNSYSGGRQGKHGMGTAGAAALGVGGGLLGGMLIENMIENHDEREREEGFSRWV